MKASRVDGRKADEIRPVAFVPDIAPNATGSVLVQLGNTQVICAVSIEEDRPRWMKDQRAAGGWITAEYSLLPYSTQERARREVSAGKIGGRTHEIQRLIGRSLRAVVDLEVLGERTVWVDCDVLQADGGTRTAAITGSYVALQRAISKLIKSGGLVRNPIKEAVAAISVGVVGEEILLDLTYTEDVEADVDMNLVMTASGKFVEVQGTAEGEPFPHSVLNKLLSIGQAGIEQVLAAQEKALKDVLPS